MPQFSLREGLRGREEEKKNEINWGEKRERGERKKEKITNSKK